MFYGAWKYVNLCYVKKSNTNVFDYVQIKLY